MKLHPEDRFDTEYQFRQRQLLSAARRRRRRHVERKQRLVQYAKLFVEMCFLLLLVAFVGIVLNVALL